MGLFDADAVLLDEDIAKGLLDEGLTPSPDDSTSGEQRDESSSEEGGKNNNPNKNADLTLDSADLFGNESGNGEKVGDENNKGTQEKPDSSKNGSANTFSSIAESMRDEGILPEDIDVASVKDADSLREAFNKAVESKQNAMVQRVNKALEANVQPSEIRNFENEISTIDKVYTNDALSLETPQAEALRKNIMMADYTAQGFSKEKAARFVEQSFKMGTDKEDAKEAAQSYRKIVQSKYDGLVAEGQKKVEAEREEVRKTYEEQKDQILNKDKVFDSFAVPSAMRQKVLDNMTKNVAVDTNGNPCTAVEKYFEEHPKEANRYTAMFYTLTKGFTDFSELSKAISKKEKRNAFASLEEKLQNTSRLPDGSLDFASGVDSDSTFSGDWQPYLGE